MTAKTGQAGQAEPVGSQASALRVLTLGGEAATNAPARRTSLVIGNFDGVHRGHAAVIDQAVADAKSASLAPAVLTFDPHPAAVLGRGEPPRLTTLADRALLLEKRGIERLYIRRFDRELASWSPERFAEELLVGELAIGEVIVGENFRFGNARKGDLATLISLGKSLGFVARAHAIAGDTDGAFSSTRARAALARGDIEEAAKVLGRSHKFSGVVVHGDARGRTLGFPTANLSEIPELVPANGVYAVRVAEVVLSANAGAGAGDEAGSAAPMQTPTSELAAELDAQRAARPVEGGLGVMNVGTRPTVAGGAAERRVEVHVLDVAAGSQVGGAVATLDLYGKRLRIEVVAKIRDERRFDGLDALKAQIARDSDEARRVLQSVQ